MLLTSNDYARISRVLSQCRMDEPYRELSGTRLTVRALPGGKAWTVAMVIQARVETAAATRIKTFESVEELRGWVDGQRVFSEV